jgi:hypothetical protein
MRTSKPPVESITVLITRTLRREPMDVADLMGKGSMSQYTNQHGVRIALGVMQKRGLVEKMDDRKWRLLPPPGDGDRATETVDRLIGEVKRLRSELIAEREKTAGEGRTRETLIQRLDEADKLLAEVR